MKQLRQDNGKIGEIGEMDIEHGQMSKLERHGLKKWAVTEVYKNSNATSANACTIADYVGNRLGIPVSVEETTSIISEYRNGLLRRLNNPRY